MQSNARFGLIPASTSEPIRLASYSRSVKALDSISVVVSAPMHTSKGSLSMGIEMEILHTKIEL